MGIDGRRSEPSRASRSNSVWPHSLFDGLARLGSLFGLSMPIFWTGLVLIVVFSLWLNWLPVGGAGSLTHLILPSVTLALPSVAMIARMTRAAVLDVLREDYVRTARAKGVGEFWVLARHTLRNAFIPILTLLGLQSGQLMGGAVLTETVFAWPGLGRLMVKAVFPRDHVPLQAALLVCVLSVLIALAGGLVLGTISGFAGGWLGAIMMRGIEILLAFPYLLLALAIVAAMGTGALNPTIAVGVWGIPTVTRMVRGSVLALRETEYVGAARALGAAVPALLRRHILPNILPGLVVYPTLFMANAILLEAALSFLPLGVQPPTASLGLMGCTGRDVLLVAPHVATVPGLAIMVAVLGFNLVGDGLRDALDPRLVNGR